MIDVLLNALVPIFAVMALGYLAGWIRDIDNRHVAELNALVMDFTLPASLFVATASTSRASLLAQWPLLLVFIVSMLALCALSYWMQRRMFGLRSSEASVQALTIALPNYMQRRAASDRRRVRCERHDLCRRINRHRLDRAVAADARHARGQRRRQQAGREISAWSCGPSATRCASRSCSDSAVTRSKHDVMTPSP